MLSWILLDISHLRRHSYSLRAIHEQSCVHRNPEFLTDLLCIRIDTGYMAVSGTNFAFVC